jgi:CrcB protein
VTRYGVGGWVQRLLVDRPGAVFPWGTLLINITGCALMGLLTPILFERSLARPEFRMAILVGFLGAYTTWSSFSIETLRLLNDGDWRHALGYFIGTNVGCFAAVWIAYRLTEWCLTAARIGR